MLYFMSPSAVSLLSLYPSACLPNPRFDYKSASTRARQKGFTNVVDEKRLATHAYPRLRKKRLYKHHPFHAFTRISRNSRSFVRSHSSELARFSIMKASRHTHFSDHPLDDC